MLIDLICFFFLQKNPKKNTILQDYYSSSSVCYSLHIRSKKISGWIFSFLIHGVFIFICSILNAGLYVNMMKKIIQSSKILSEEEYKKRMSQILRTAFLITVSNIISWFPISILGILRIKNHKISLTLIYIKYRL